MNFLLYDFRNFRVFKVVFKYLEDNKNSNVPDIFLVFSVCMNIMFLYSTIPTSFSDRERKPARTITYPAYPRKKSEEI